MRILGIDPGKTTGWCLYQANLGSGSFEGFVFESGSFEGYGDQPLSKWGADVIVLERPVVYHGSPPAVGDACYCAGYLACLAHQAEADYAELTRLEVKKALSEATHREIVCRDDATVWAALKLLHGGEGAGKKGGPLYGVKSHARAALAVAVAFVLTRRTP